MNQTIFHSNLKNQLESSNPRLARLSFIWEQLSTSSLRRRFEDRFVDSFQSIKTQIASGYLESALTEMKQTYEMLQQSAGHDGTRMDFILMESISLLQPLLMRDVSPDLSVVVPVYNESGTLEIILEKVVRQLSNMSYELIIIDNGSDQQGTFEALRNVFGRYVLSREPKTVVAFQNRKFEAGKGAASRLGFRLARGKACIIQDSDLEYDPVDIDPVVRPILEGRALCVYGSRLEYTRKHRHASPLFYFGGRLVTIVTNLLFGSRLTDEPTGYKAFNTALIQGLEIETNGFEWEPEVTAKILNLGISIQEVPISYLNPRKPGEKKIRWHDGLKAIWTLIRYRVKFWFRLN